MADRYDLCVLGAGTAGFAAAREAVRLGARVALVSEEGALGGTCIRRGCMPAKTLLSSTERLGEVASASDVGVATRGAGVDLDAIVRRKRELVDYFTNDRASELEKLPLVRGRATFVGPHAVALDANGRRIDAERFVIATGSTIDAPPWPGFARAEYMTSDDALETTHLPPSLVVIGGGPVGCEFAQYFARLGARVTLLQDAPEVLRNEDADVGAAVREALVADGVDVVCDATIVAAAPGDGGGRRVSYDVRGERRALHASYVMVATGRRPRVRDLELAAANVALDADGGIAVDACLRSLTAPAVFAAGDALGRRCLVHVAEYAGKLAASNALGRTERVAEFDRFETHAVYTQPQVAVAGLTERALRERGVAVRTRHHAFEDVGKAVVSGEARGFIKMTVDEDDRLRGVAIVAADAIDLIGEAIALIDRGATAREVSNMPHLHPTMGEIFARVADDFEDAACR